jgi:superfamily II DNA or RNA helicase/HKD family nuclease
MKFQTGLYEQLVTEGLHLKIASLDARVIQRRGLHQAEAANRLALHLSRQIESVLSALPEKERVSAAIQVARALLDKLGHLTNTSNLGAEMPVSTGEILHAVTKLLPDGTPMEIDSPLIPLLDTTLLTNAPGEPRVGHQIVTEIQSAQRIDILMAFIRSTGIHPMREALRRHIRDGGQVRVLTTTYTGSTQYEALDALAELGADVRVSYDLTTTRLHAKAWLFYRETGFSTAYIGSSNLTHSAQVTGLEWNVRVSGARNPDVLDKVRAVFDSYWEGGDFRKYDRSEFQRQTVTARSEGLSILLSPLAVEPRPFQERLLEELAVSRLQGWHRNLLVAATGTGKTVMAALDYARLRGVLRRDRLLFVAHRQEILDQSQRTFRHVLREPGFGEQWIGGRRPKDFEHVFASIQSLNAANFEHLEPGHFDVVIIDEFHHAAAPSYESLLQRLTPVELLGLTATPERADGLSVLDWFDGRIAAELRLWDAIDQNYLCPFFYYGVHDGLDLSEIPWRRGSGYDVEELTNLLTGGEVWAEFVVKQFREKTENSMGVRALGFCVSVRHANHMAAVFNKAGIRSVAIWGNSPEEERRSALRALDRGDVQVVFSVDLLNEGVDVPSVDVLLMLRPTESGTLFLQQLGRGLRKKAGKTGCVVLDFVGQHRKEFRYDRRFKSLFGGTRKDLQRHIEHGFPYLPAGCHMELDEVSRDLVLSNIKAAIPTRWAQKVRELREFIRAGHELSLHAFLDHSGLELQDIYEADRTWIKLCTEAGVATSPEGIQETALRRAVARLLHIDDFERIELYQKILGEPMPPILQSLAERERRLIRMLIVQLLDGIGNDALPQGGSLEDALRLLWAYPNVMTDIRVLLGVLRQRITHVHCDLPNRIDVPIKVHASYSRAEILAGFGVGTAWRSVEWREGVRWVADAKADLFAITFDKTGKGFSPTTRYKDYAISSDLIHWESQSGTRPESESGQRYQLHRERGSDVVLFARLNGDTRAFWCLGTADYVRHEGERPMSIVWKLHHALPGDLFTQFAAAIA